MSVLLRHPLPSVQNGIQRSCGGNQAWSGNHRFQLCGCGVVGCLDLLIYLGRYQNGCSAKQLAALVERDPVPIELYDQAALLLSRRFLPLIPRVGLNGLSLAAGFNLFCVRNHIPFRARWGVSGKRFWSSIRSMLSRDIPVILSIGPNLPFFWQQNSLRLYRRNADGNFQPSAEAVAHYVTVSGMDEKWLRISSWGREYYIEREEYLRYIRAHSNRIVSNILLVERK